MGVVLVGPSGCGKTTIWKVLKKAYEKILNSAKDLYKSSPNILMYLKALMQNTEVTETIASTYYNEVSTNETLNELRENVQKYLIAKLENNEC